jgi:hypothetical protein
LDCYTTNCSRCFISTYSNKTAIINGANVLKTSTAKITPNATQVAKVLKGGVAGYALSIAVEQIIGADYSWWIDGDSVKYLLPTDPNNVPKCWYPHQVWVVLLLPQLLLRLL